MSVIEYTNKPGGYQPTSPPSPGKPRSPQALRSSSERLGGRARGRGSVSHGDVAEMPLECLEAQLVDVARYLASGTYELLVLVGELDARGGWATWGALSCAAWLADVCDIEVCTARTQVRVANALRRWPTLDAAMRDGDVSYAKARTLAPHLSDENVEALVGIAAVTPAGRLGAAIAAWAHRHEDDHVIAARQHDARSCTWRTEPDGMVTITVRLEPAVAGSVCAVIDQKMIVSTAPAGTTAAQQRADALVALVIGDTRGGGHSEGDRNRLDNSRGGGGDDGGGNRPDGSSGGGHGRGERQGRESNDGGEGSACRGRVDAELVIHVREDGNTLTDGTPVSNHAVAGLLPEAFISLLIHDTQRQPIDASPRRRTPTRRQRRVLDERETECAHPGCHARSFLQYDHIDRYTDDGPTVIDNLQRLCGPHNRAKEREASPRSSSPK